MSFVLLALTLAAAPKPVAIEVTDAATGRGIPLVELRTTNHLRYVTDNAGVTAFDEPGLMDTEVFFSLNAPGYEVPKDGFGIAGVRLTPKAGDKLSLKLKRTDIAERLYRITGDGVFAESVKLGREVPFDKPGTNARVLGCDSVFVAEYRKELFWIWGDTTQAKYPLGNFHTTAATTPLSSKSGIDPDAGYQFVYMDDGKGFVKGVCPMPGKGPTWVEALVVLPGKDGQERLWAEYVKVDSKMTPQARGLAVFDDAKKEFVHHTDVPLSTPILPTGHTFKHTDGKTEHLYFGNPFPLVRVPATEAAFTDLTKYEAFTCLKPGSTVAKPEIDRDDKGRARYEWRTNVPPLHPEDETKLLKAKVLTADDVRFQLTAGAGTVTMHRGSVNWNAYRKRWVMLATQIGGKESFLGEVWYAEAERLTGPYGEAVKVASHPKMSFYNPVHHPFFDRDGGKTIYFEGTYTTTFSGNPDPTPRYEYNQLMYKLDLTTLK
jgi:hypothetical protein